jgi:hypothetical protein
VVWHSVGTAHLASAPVFQPGPQATEDPADLLDFLLACRSSAPGPHLGQGVAATQPPVQSVAASLPQWDTCRPAMQSQGAPEAPAGPHSAMLPCPWTSDCPVGHPLTGLHGLTSQGINLHLSQGSQANAPFLPYSCPGQTSLINLIVPTGPLPWFWQP